jgi:hypothetical protein
MDVLTRLRLDHDLELVLRHAVWWVDRWVDRGKLAVSKAEGTISRPMALIRERTRVVEVEVAAAVAVIAVLDNVRPPHTFVDIGVGDECSDSLPVVEHEMLVAYVMLAQSTIPGGSTTAYVIGEDDEKSAMSCRC